MKSSGLIPAIRLINSEKQQVRPTETLTVENLLPIRLEVRRIEDASSHFVPWGICALVLLLFPLSMWAQSFSLSVSQAITVYPGQGNVSLPISVSSSDYTGPVNVTVVGLPSGITVIPASLTVTPGTSATITLNVGVHADEEAFPANNAAGPWSATTTVQVVGAVGSTTVSIPMNLTVSLNNPAFAPAASAINLPIMNINTSGVGITSQATDVSGSITITSADGSTTYLPSASNADNTATFHVHGNTTAVMEKLPYHIKLNTSLDLLSQMGSTCPYMTSSGKAICDKGKSYILLANFDDKTMLRDWSASALANAIPFGSPYLNETPVPSGNKGIIPTPSGSSALLPWAPHSVFVELYLNGAYEGTYQLIEEVKVDSHRVNVPELTETETSGDLSGGYLMEIDHHEDEAYVFNTPQGLPIGLIDPDFTPDPEVSEQTSYISNYVNSAETALFTSGFTDPIVGWRGYFDEASAINFYLVNEIMGNVDGGDFYSSVYLYKAPDNPFLYMGPVWDFDISSGNVNYESIVNPTVPWMQVEASWYAQWFKDPAFKADVIKQFNTLKNSGLFTNWVSSISKEAANLQQAQANNYQRWPMLGITVWPNPEAAGTYDGEVQYLVNFINLRIAYLDAMFNNKTLTTTVLSLPAAPYYLGSSESLVAHVSGVQSPTGVVSFFSGQVLVGAAGLDATGVATLSTSNLLPGSNGVTAVYSGDAANALSSSSLTMINVVAAPEATEANLSASVTSATQGTSVSLGTSVLSNGTGSQPSGAISFFTNGTLIGSANLSGGTATYTATNLPVGTNTIQAVYAGDSTHQESSSNAVSVVIRATTVQVIFATGPSGLSFSLDGTSYTSPQTLSLVQGSVHTLATTSPQSVGESQDTWASWSDGGAQTHSITVPVAAFAYSAIFNVASSSPFAGINFASGFTAGAMTLNGSAALSGKRLRLTDGNSYEAASAFYPTAINVQSFTNDFTFQLSDASADGLMFVLQGQGATALGGVGGDLGFGTSIQKSIGIKFDLYNNSGEGINSTGLYMNGASPTIPATDLTSNGIDLHSGDVFQVHMVYNGTTLTVVITDIATQKSATQSYTVNIPAIVGGNTAYLGFTAGTGGETATQEVLSWTLVNTVNTATTPAAISLNSGFAAGSVSLNGSAEVSGTRLRLTDGNVYEAASAFYPTAVEVQSFTTDFTFQLTNALADGIMFVLQNQGAAALGGFGASLGYGAGVQKSVGIKFDLYNNSGEGSNSTGLYINGSIPTTPATDLSSTGINLHSGDIFQVHMVYDGRTLTVTITDPTLKKSATQSYIINIPTIVGGGTAYVGFTAGTGGETATQDILSWTFVSTTSTALKPATIGLSGGFAAGSVSLNGSASLNGERLRLTDGGTYETASAFYPTPVGVQSFTNDFTFQLTNPFADGLMFVFQNQGASALGSFGGDLGYGHEIKKSVGVKFDLYDNLGEGASSTGLYINGASPTTPATDLSSMGVNLHSGDVFQVHMAYDGTNMTVVITDIATQMSATQSYTVNIPATVGSNTAYVGFTAGTGEETATQDILSWTLALN